MKCSACLVMTVCAVVLSRAWAADHSLIGEWFPLKNSDGGLGGTMMFKTNDSLTLNERKGRQRQRLSRVEGTGGDGLFSRWTGKHYTGGRQILEFTTNLYGYLTVPFQTVTSSYALEDKTLTIETQGDSTTFRWAVDNDVLTLASGRGSRERLLRKGASSAGDVVPFTDESDAETEMIEALLKHLEGLEDASFIRNDESYEMKDGAAMMRRKWGLMEEEIENAADFIEVAATASTSGPRLPYFIRFKDGREIKCADYLTAELRKRESRAGAGRKSVPGRLP